MAITRNKEVDLIDTIEEDDFLERWVHWALWALAAIVVVATVTGLVESYNGLYIWFATHHITGFWADWAPLTVDSFTVIGELSIFAGISRHWDWKSRVLPWVSAMIGIGSSVAANVGDKVQFHSIPTDLTGAIFPLAGAFGIVIGLGVLKRIAKDVKAKKAAKKGVTISPDDVVDQLMKDNQELAKALEKAQSTAVLDISPAEPEPVVNKDQELKGMDVLIPPTEEEPKYPEISQPETKPTPVAALFAEPEPVSREEARRRQSLRPDRGTIYQTGSFPVVS
jgi:hypothetical protein